jgi:hypothetical protein
MDAINTVTGAAESVLGTASEWRKVVANNPAELFGKLPPSLNVDVVGYYAKFKGIADKLNVQGLDKAEKEGQLVLNKLFGNRFNAVAIQAENLKPSVDKATDFLKQFDWLL